MTLEIILVLAILAVAIFLFATEKIRVDLVAVMVMISLIITGLLDTNQAFSGFANPAVITVWAIYMVSDGINRVGVADFIGSNLLKYAGNSEPRLIVFIMLTTAAMSAFTNNIGATAILLPAVVNIGVKANIPPSKLLIPLAFSSLLGGVTTLIGTPPNLLVNVALQDAGLEGFAFLDYTPMGLIILFCSVIYMVLIGRRLLPDRSGQTTANLTHHYRLRNYLTDIVVLPHSPLVGKTVVEAKLGEKYGLTVIGILRDGEIMLSIRPDAFLHEGDHILVRCTIDDLVQVSQELGIAFDPEAEIDPSIVTSAESVLTEVVVTQKAGFAGQTIREADFRGRFGLNVLAVWHEEEMVAGSIADAKIRFGDVLLVVGRQERLDAIAGSNQFLVLSPVKLEPRRLAKAPLAVGIFAVMISSVVLGWLHISTAAVIGVIAYILTGIVTMDEAYQAVEWKSVFLIAGMLPLGIAMETTGTAQFLADTIVNVVGGLGPRGVMIGLFVLTTILTAFMSNAAAAVLVAPIAINTALALDIAPHAFVMSVAIAASNAFISPVSHQSNVLVYGPGGYRFFDFTKVGVPLMVMIWVLMLIFLPIFFPF